MKKKRLYLLSAVSAAAVLAACTADEILSERRSDQLAYMAEESMPVQVVASMSDDAWGDADTRAGQSLNDGVFSLMYSTNSSSAVCLRADDGSGTYSNYQYKVVGTTGASAISAVSTPAYFPAGVTTVNVYAWYPYNSGNTSFTVNNNQSTDANYILSDLMLANKSQCKRVKSNNVYTISDANKATLTFRHVMAKLKLNVTAATGVTINSVKLAGVKRTVAISGPDGSGNVSIGNATGSGEEITVYGTIAAGSTANVAAVIPPQKLTGGFLVINATYGSKTGNVTYDLGSSGKTFEGNKVYTMTMTVNKQDILQTISIADWNAGSYNAVEVQPTPVGTGGDLDFEQSTEMTLTFNGSNGTITINDTSGATFSAVSSNSSVATASVSGKVVTVQPKGAGNAGVFVTANDGSTYGVISVTVNKAATEVTSAPTAKTNLTYTGSSQTLINAGAASTGTTMQYKLDNGSWSTSLPSATNANTSGYKVYYKAVPPNTNNYEAETAGTDYITVPVAKAAGKVTLDKSSVTDIYRSGGTATVNVSSKLGTGSLSVKSSNTNVATVSISGTTITVTGAGTAGTATITVTAAADANYNEATATFTATTVDKSPSSVTTAPTSKSPAYNGSNQALVNAGVASGGTMYYKLGSSGSWSTSVPQASGMGPYTVYYYVKGDDTHLDTGSESSPAGNVSVTFSKGTPTLSLSPASATIVAGNNTTATISRSSSNPGTLSVSAQSNSSVATGSISGTTLTVNGVAAGSATITVKVASNTYWNEKTVTFTATVKTSATTTLSALKSSWNANYLGASVYSDGTVGWATSISGKTRIGVVAYHADSDVDSAISGSRILVLAIAKAATCAWGHYGTSCDGTTHGSYTYSKSGNSGYTQTQALCNNGSDSSTHPAAYKAWNYSATIPSGGASPGHWFLPSQTQWGWMSAQRGYAGISSGWYWSSTEGDSDIAFYLYGNNGNASSVSDKSNIFNIAHACFAY